MNTDDSYRGYVIKRPKNVRLHDYLEKEIGRSTKHLSRATGVSEYMLRKWHTERTPALRLLVSGYKKENNI